MTTPATNGKQLVNVLYHRAVVTGLGISYSKLGCMVIGGAAPKLDVTTQDAGMVIVDAALGIATKDMLVLLNKGYCHPISQSN